MSHVVQHVLHGATVRQVALSYLSVGLLPPLAFVRVQQEDQLLLNQLPLLGVCSRRCGAGSRPHSIESNLHPSHCCCCPADRHTANWSRLLLLRSRLRMESRKEAQATLERLSTTKWSLSVTNLITVEHLAAKDPCCKKSPSMDLWNCRFCHKFQKFNTLGKIRYLVQQSVN